MSTSTEKPSASFEEIECATTDENILVIDVREPLELQESGVIPGSINIPLGEVENVLRDMPPEEFKARYGKEKPPLDFPIILSCRSGKRSAQAQEIANRLGFSNVKNFEGGWLDWEERTK